LRNALRLRGEIKRAHMQFGNKVPCEIPGWTRESWVV
jgi:hypothetical protein